MNALDRWIDAACRALGLDPAEAATGPVLDLARDVAHGVLRPGAPATAYLAVGRGADPEVIFATLSDLARSWQPPAEASTEASPSGDG